MIKSDLNNNLNITKFKSFFLNFISKLPFISSNDNNQNNNKDSQVNTTTQQVNIITQLVNQYNPDLIKELKKEIEFLKSNIKENKENYLTFESIAFLKLLEETIPYYQAFVIPFALANIFLSLPISAAIGYIFVITYFLKKNFGIFEKSISKISQTLNLPKLSNFFDKIGGILSYIPLYPTIKATTKLKKEIIDTLDTLPLKNVNKASIIEINDKLNDSYDALGVTFNKITSVPIYLHSNPAPYDIKYVLIHELGHANDFYNNIPFNYKSSILGLIPKFPFGFKNFVSEYASTKATEDFAESFASYYTDPENLKNISPIKYYLIHFNNKVNFIEKIIDNQYVRKFLKTASLLIPAPIRLIMDILSFKHNTSLIKNNINKLIQSNNKNDLTSYINAKLNLLTAFLLINKSLYSIFLIPLKYIMNKAINKGILNKNIANKLVNLSLSYAIGPLGTVIGYSLNSKNNKLIPLLAGLTNIFLFNTMKFAFPYLIPILIPLEKLTTFGIMELITNLLNPKNSISNNLNSNNL